LSATATKGGRLAGYLWRWCRGDREGGHSMRRDSPTGSAFQRFCIIRHTPHTFAMSDSVMARGRCRTVAIASRNSASASWGTRSRLRSTILSKQATNRSASLR
jgi:hypothetical protein